MRRGEHEHGVVGERGQGEIGFARAGAEADPRLHLARERRHRAGGADLGDQRASLRKPRRRGAAQRRPRIHRPSRPPPDPLDDRDGRRWSLPAALRAAASAVRQGLAIDSRDRYAVATSPAAGWRRAPARSASESDSKTVTSSSRPSARVRPRNRQRLILAGALARTADHAASLPASSTNSRGESRSARSSAGCAHVHEGGARALTDAGCGGGADASEPASALRRWRTRRGRGSSPPLTAPGPAGAGRAAPNRRSGPVGRRRDRPAAARGRRRRAGRARTAHRRRRAGERRSARRPRAAP